MPRKILPRLRTVTIKGKEFHQVSIPQPGGGRRLKTFKDADEASDRTRLIVTGVWLPGYLSMATTQGWNYLNKASAGCTKDTSVKLRPKSKPVIEMPRIQHNPASLASGKILGRYRCGSGAKRNVRGCKGQVRFKPD
jgi:hypothetical protein